MNDYHLISIIVPVYNRSHLIGTTLQSIINQTYQHWECIVVDDYSNDNTEEIVLKYCLDDKRIKYVKNQRKKGAPGARNTGLILANGNYICFFDSDDVMYINNLEKKVNFLILNKSVDVVTSFSKILNQNDIKIGEFCYQTEGDILSNLLKGNIYVDTNSALIRKSCFKDEILWDEECQSYQEYEFHLKLSTFATYGYISEFLIDYYRRDKDTISSDFIKDIKGRLYIYNKFKYEIINEIGLNHYISRIKEINKEIINLGIKNPIFFSYFKNLFHIYLLKIFYKKQNDTKNHI